MESVLLLLLVANRLIGDSPDRLLLVLDPVPVLLRGGWKSTGVADPVERAVRLVVMIDDACCCCYCNRK